MPDQPANRDDRPQWPEELLDASVVRRWIADVVGRRASQVRGPTETLWAKTWGATARFEADREVVFKGWVKPIFLEAPAVLRLLDARCATSVPRHIAAERVGLGVWTLFEPFEGDLVGASGICIEDVVDVARTFGRIQREVVGSDLRGIPHTRVTDIPVMLDDVTADVERRYAPSWRVSGDATLADVSERMSSVRQAVSDWSDELASADWPLTLDHTDLHVGNAVRTSGGQVLLFDWEEARASCPYFSLDRLLDDATHVDGGESAVVDAYLDEVPWAHRRHLDLALKLAPIKTLHEGTVFFDAQGWEQGNEYFASMYVRKALERWQTS